MKYWPKDKKWDFHHITSKVLDAPIESAKYIPKLDPPTAAAENNDRSTKTLKQGPVQSNARNKPYSKTNVSP